METLKDPVCCPKFDPIPWNEKYFEWKDKIFVKGSVCTFFYMPLNYGSVMKKLDKAITVASSDWSEAICLSDQTSKWNMDIYISVDKAVNTLENKIFTGKYYSKVYEGPFRECGKWILDFNQHLVSKGYNPVKVYSWYTTCPKCAKKYGKNYVVMVAEVS
ncbi:MAG TPA: hydrolase [Prolixibacteraceae bacterium]|nr:hydrolase [Prolixibacteraceae bacterium]